MKRILILIIGLIGVAYGQSSPTSSKTRFVNGLYVGTKLDAYFNAADSNVIYWRADSVIMAKYKGAARTVAFTYDPTLPFVTPEQFGAVGDGITSDVTAFQNAIASGKTIILSSNKRYYIPSQLTLGASQKLIGASNTKIKIENNKGIIVSSGSQIIGVSFVGSGKDASVTDEVGVFIRSKSNALIDGCTFDSIGNYAIFVDSTTTTDFGLSFSSNDIVSPVILRSNTGIYYGVRGEYVNTLNVSIRNCDTAINMTGGNNKIIGGNILDNTIGFFLSTDNINDAHAATSGLSLNHNVFNLYAKDVDFAYVFSACSFQVGKIKVENSNNITISNSIIFADSVINVNSINFRLLDNILRNSFPTQNTGAFSNFYRGNDLTYSYTSADSITYSLLGNINGSGTTNYVSKFSSSNGISNSQIFDNGSFVGINTTDAVGSDRLVVSGGLSTTGTIRSQATGAQFRISGGGTDAGIWMTGANNNLKFARWSDGGGGMELDVSSGVLTSLGGFVKSGGTSTQALIADGSVQTLTSGTYTPTLTNTTNISSSTAQSTNWTRIGNVVTVYTTASATTSAAGNAELTFSLPISTTTPNPTLTGSGIDSVRFSVTQGSSSGTTVGARWTATSGTATTIYITFQYVVN